MNNFTDFFSAVFICEAFGNAACLTAVVTLVILGRGGRVRDLLGSAACFGVALAISLAAYVDTTASSAPPTPTKPIVVTMQASG